MCALVIISIPLPTETPIFPQSFVSGKRVLHPRTTHRGFSFVSEGRVTVSSEMEKKMWPNPLGTYRSWGPGITSLNYPCFVSLRESSHSPECSDHHPPPAPGARPSSKQDHCCHTGHSFRSLIHMKGHSVWVTHEFPHSTSACSRSQVYTRSNTFFKRTET